MKKKYLLFIGLIFFAVQLHANPVPGIGKELSAVSRLAQRARGSAKMLRKKCALNWRGHLLDIQAKVTYKRAQQLQGTIRGKNFFFETPVNHLSKFTIPTVQHLLNDAPYLLDEAILANEELAAANCELVGDYLVAQENYRYIAEVQRLQNEVWPRLHALLPRLKQEAATFPQPKDPISFIVHHISPRVRIIFAGENHYTRAIPRAIGDWLALMRAEYPDKKFKIFVEFLPQNFTWEGEIPDWYTEEVRKETHGISGFNPEHIELYERARALGIETVGLEPWEVYMEQPVFEPIISDKTHMYTSLTGIDYRNEKFMETILQALEEDPDLIPIVYTGAFHSAYDAPYSLARNFKPEETFVIKLGIDYRRRYAKEVLSGELDILPPELLEQVRLSGQEEEFIQVLLKVMEKMGLSEPKLDGMSTRENYLSQPFLYLSDKELVQAAGFDVYLNPQDWE